MRHEPLVIISDGLKPAPEQHEVGVAWILARHYRCTVEFLHPTRGYKAKTPDIVMNGLMWELKSPVGTSRTTVENQFKRGLHQSRYVVIDSRRTKLSQQVMLKQVAASIQKHSRIQSVIFISKHGKVIEFLK